ncbi:mannose-6-phosphate isomerase, class I [Halalkalibacter kiskunsagensis]|uniref:Mannose-6-phosphate isomerase n=1 Tax=Halalkalibacter kiskunsagensis TaxID=1548599 RepID=A0ABV6K6T6_9BACI
MVKELLFFEPIFKERIWGGSALKELFGYDIPSESTGECWAISGHPNGRSIVKNGLYEGMTLDQLWKEHRELFGNNSNDVFPLLIKILDANEDLSVQVHPNDMYAKINEKGELGKTECWYIIDCKEDAKIILGHNAQTEAELREQISKGEWESLLRTTPIKPGDFFFVPSGTVHALCEGTIVLETQQSSDSTYRVFDYDRKDANGELRELQLDKAIDVINVPHSHITNKPKITKQKDALITTFVESNYFTVHKWSIDGTATFTYEQSFLLCSVIDGEGEIIIEGEGVTYIIRKGDHFIVPATVYSFSIIGKVEMIVSHD